MNRSPVTTKCYCNVVAQQRGLNPAGSAGSFADALVVETALPWGSNIYEKAGKLPQEAIDLLSLWLKRYYEGVPYDHLTLMIAPDPTYSRPGFRRVMYFVRPEAPFAGYKKHEYLLPDNQVGALIWALFEAKSDLPRFESYRVPNAEAIRDLMVCTHGTVDVACARFGYPLYRQLREQFSKESLRVWRVSHFGGHVFAPTLLDLPTGHLWAYVEDTQAQQIVMRTGAMKTLREHYRGWSGLDSGMMQAAEGAIWQREGWRWFDYPKQATIIAQSSEADPTEWMDVRIAFTTPDGTGAYNARVETFNVVETEHSTHNAALFPYPQYRVAQLERVK